MAAPEPDYDLDEFRQPEPDWVKGLGKELPKLPKLGLPMAIPGLPLLPNFLSMFFSVDAKTPKFIKDVADDIKYDNLYRLIVETGLDQIVDVDLDVDLTVEEVAAAIRKAAGDLDPGAAGKIASAVAEAMDADLGDFIKAPKLPKLGLPMAIPGLPLLPDFASLDFPLGAGDPLEHLASWLKE